MQLVIIFYLLCIIHYVYPLLFFHYVMDKIQTLFTKKWFFSL